MEGDPSEALLEQILEELRGLQARELQALWRRKELALYFGVGKNRAGQIAAQPTFPQPVDVGGGERWVPDEVRAWAKQQRKRRR